jgi:hypothetical protein
LPEAFHGKEGSTVRVRQRALQKPRKSRLSPSAELARTPVCVGYGAVMELSVPSRLPVSVKTGPVRSRSTGTARRLSARSPISSGLSTASARSLTRAEQVLGRNERALTRNSARRCSRCPLRGTTSPTCSGYVVAGWPCLNTTNARTSQFNARMTWSLSSTCSSRISRTRGIRSALRVTWLYPPIPTRAERLPAAAPRRSGPSDRSAAVHSCGGHAKG